MVEKKNKLFQESFQDSCSLQPEEGLAQQAVGGSAQQADVGTAQQAVGGSTQQAVGGSTQPTVVTTPISKKEPPPVVDPEIEAYLTQTFDNPIVNREKVKTISKQQIKEIISRISKTHNVGMRTAYIATAELFRRGAANAGAPDSMFLELECQETGYATELRRYDLVMALYSVMGYKNLRKLAEAMAPEIVRANLNILNINPLADLKGDLANRINFKLHLRKEEALSRREEICCCTYTQWMPNLNDLAYSTRLKGLLEEDLNARRKRAGKQSLEKEKTKKRIII